MSHPLENNSESEMKMENTPSSDITGERLGTSYSQENTQEPCSYSRRTPRNHAVIHRRTPRNQFFIEEQRNL
jgi:hypothetical protein